MPSLFDQQRKVMYGTVLGLYGVVALWNSLDGLISFTGTVLVNTPTIKDLVDGSGFIVETPYFEYNLDDIPGLKIRVDTKGSYEVIIIDDIPYFVTGVELKNDGKNGKAYLLEANEQYGPQRDPIP